MTYCQCPECDASLEIKDDSLEYIFCQYCGTKIIFDDHPTVYVADDSSSENARYRTYDADEAELLTALEEWQERKERHDQQGKYLLILALGVVITGFLSVILHDTIIGSYFSTIATITGCGGFFFGTMWLTAFDKKEDVIKRVRDNQEERKNKRIKAERRGRRRF